MVQFLRVVAGRGDPERGGQRAFGQLQQARTGEVDAVRPDFPGKLRRGIDHQFGSVAPAGVYHLHDRRPVVMRGFAPELHQFHACLQVAPQLIHEGRGIAVQIRGDEINVRQFAGGNHSPVCRGKILRRE